MQHTTKAAKPLSQKKMKKADGYLLYDTIICCIVGTRLRDTVEGEEKRIKAKATKKVSIRYLRHQLP